MRCLLVVDVQNGFVSDRTRSIVPKIEQLMHLFKDDLILATKFINLDNSAFDNYMNWSKMKTPPETDLIAYVNDLSDKVFEKNVYSSCTNPLMDFLYEHSITEVYIVGIDTDCCVLKTASDLFERNIRPIVLIDYCASNGGDESHRSAIRVMERTIGKKQIFYGEYNQ